MLDDDPAGHPVARSLPPRDQYRVLGFVALGVLVIFAITAALGWLRRPAEKAQPFPQPGTFRATPDQIAALKIMPVGLGQQSDNINATGTITVDEDHATPVLMPYSGQVTQVLVEAGQHVTVGQPLLKIKTPEYVDARNALLSAISQHANSVSQLRLAQENAHRQQEIYASAGGAFKDLQQARNDLVTAQSALRSADAALGTARDRLAILGKSPDEIHRLESVNEVSGIHAETTLHAPSAGIIASRSVAPGQYVTIGGDKPVMTIADPTSVWLVAQLPESVSSRVGVGDGVNVTTPAFPGRVFRAVIDNVAAGLDPATHRLAVRATIANRDLALKPQMFASFTILRAGSGASAILVPAAAVIHEGDVARVWVAGKDNLLSARLVSVVDAGNGASKVVAGLRPGERIVTAGAIFVNEAGLGE
jgi:cobalt-zinc-cadmium efflux system membrane fusion protein